MLQMKNLIFSIVFRLPGKKIEIFVNIFLCFANNFSFESETYFFFCTHSLEDFSHERYDFPLKLNACGLHFATEYYDHWAKSQSLLGSEFMEKTRVEAA